MSKLNAGQSKAVSYTSGPLLILAGPGSGKTLTITQKVLQLIKDGISPDRILALTFSEKAAGEMQDRIEKHIGVGTGITVSTFHSFCNDLIREFSLDLGINRGTRLISKEHSHVWGIKNIDLFGFDHITLPSNPTALITSLLEGVSQFHDHLILPEDLETYVSTSLTSGATLTDDEKDQLLKLGDLAKFYYHYQQYKWDNNFIDYDDMIHLACDLLESNHFVRNKVGSRYDHILVDEFQDTNYAQLHLIHLMAEGGNLTCVADDDQCIYRFRGAYLSNINQLKTFYPSLEKVTLDVNYRSTEQIVNISQQLIEINPEREQKNLVSGNGAGELIKVVKAPDDESEAEWVAGEVKRLVEKEGIEPRDIYILTRKRDDGRKFSEALRLQMIPTEDVGRLQLTYFPIVQEALAYMRIVSDPFNNGISFAKVFSREGVKEHNLQKVNIMARKLVRNNGAQGDGIYTVLLNHLDDIDIDQRDLVASVIDRMQELIDHKKNHLPSDTLKHLLMEKTDLYRSVLQEDTRISRKNIEVLNALVRMVEDLELIGGGSEFEEVMEHMVLVFDMDIENGEAGNENTVKIMTIHQSKGKEAKAVFVCDMAARHLPLQHQKKTFTVPLKITKGVQRGVEEKVLHLEEERRLAYVAMTRAKEKLYLVFPEKYLENSNASKPSQFLNDIDHTQNPLVELIEANTALQQFGLTANSPLKLKMDEYEAKVSMYARQGQLKQALESLLVLAQLRELEQSGDPANFDMQRFLQVTLKDPAELQDLIDDRLPALVDPGMRFSASKIKEYIDCPLKFKYNNILHIPTPHKTHLQVGTGIHAVYEEMARQKMQGNTPLISDAVKMLADTWDGSVFPSATQEKQERSKMEKMLEFWFRFEKTNPNETIAIEERFDLSINGSPFTGFIDRLDRTPTGDHIVIDYKTNKTPYTKNELKEDVQIALYCLAVKEKYGKLPVKAGHMYVHPNVSKLNLIDIEATNVDAVLEKVKEAVEGILDEDFELKVQPNCYFCDYKGICEWL
jgi:DNA helicase-2/ATP-dependent DNA helicase PcrA